MIQAKTVKKVAVIGGGIAGMEAARIAAKRGHNVTIYEKGGKLGGVTIAASVPDYKAASRRLLKWLEKEVNESGVKVELNKELTLKDVKKLDADAVVVSTGSTAKVPPITGVQNKNVVAAIDVLLGKVKVGQNVVIIGGGQVGCEVGYDLLREGKNVAVVEFLNGIIAGVKEPVSEANILMLEDLLNYYKADIRLSTAVKEIKEDSVIVEKDGVQDEIPADTVVLATGYAAKNDIYNSLKDSEKEIYLLGDAKTPSNIMHAVADGNEAGRAI